MTESTIKPARANRRAFLQWSIFGLLFAFFGAAVNVIIRYLMPPPLAPKATKSAVKKLSVPSSQIPLGGSLNVEYKGIPVILIHTEKGFAAFNATCTHLGCIVKWFRSDQTFDCPCHGGKYDTSGKVLAGPPPEPLHKINIKIKNGTITFV